MCRTLARRFFWTFFRDLRKWSVLGPGPCLGPWPLSCTPAPHQRSQETNRNQRQSQKESRIPNMSCTLAPIFLERSGGQVLEMVSLGPWPMSWAPSLSWTPPLPVAWAKAKSGKGYRRASQTIWNRIGFEGVQNYKYLKQGPFQTYGIP